MGASGVIDETETGGADPAEPSVPAPDRIEGVFRGSAWCFSPTR